MDQDHPVYSFCPIWRTAQIVCNKASETSLIMNKRGHSLGWRNPDVHKARNDNDLCDDTVSLKIII